MCLVDIKFKLKKIAQVFNIVKYLTFISCFIVVIPIWSPLVIFMPQKIPLVNKMYLIFQICYRARSIHFIKNSFGRVYLVSNDCEVVCPQILNTDRDLADRLSHIRVEKYLGNGFP